jgi:NAD(P)-dependent dehydrogenase (short-subunit alcohol dehydrogenase family)
MGSRPALVTGASRGIGRAVALELADRGYEVVATMRDPVSGSELAAHDAITVERLDVTDPESIRMPEGIQVLVNNAAVELSNRAVEDTSLDEWRTVFETNLFGLVDVTRRAIPAMRQAGGGVICNITTSALLLPMPFYAVYRASKAAVAALGESLRLELAPHKIRLVEILPGPIDTEMLAGSSVVPEAIESEPYRLLAERVAEARSGMADVKEPVDQAARAIVDAIEDTEGPLRYACDPFAAGMLETWRHQSDEDAMQDMLRAFEG